MYITPASDLSDKELKAELDVITFALARSPSGSATLRSRMIELRDETTIRQQSE